MTLPAGEVLRKLIHMSGVVAIPVLYALGAARTAALFFALVAGLYAYPSIARLTRPTPFGGFFNAFRRALDFLERKGRTKYEGAMYFFASIGAIALLFPATIASIAIMVTSIGDGVSTLVGRNFGRKRLFYNRSKSLEGSVAGFAASAAGCALITTLPAALFLSAAGMIVESIDSKVNDNVSVPFSVAVAAYLAAASGLIPI